MRIVLALLLFSLSCQIHGQAPELEGSVFHDLNNNGIREPGENGISGVYVSDQLNVVQTDLRGNFRIRSDTNKFPYIFISLPTGYSGKYYLPKDGPLNFGLKTVESADTFTFIHASDTHIDSLNLPRMARFRTMADSLQVAFTIITGDLIRDALRVPEATAAAYFEMYLEEVRKFKAPVYSAVGNHELFGIERDKSLVPADHPLYGKKMFRKYLGPNYYSFNYGGIHFVAIDGVQYDNLYYYGGVDSLQLNWLASDLKALDPSIPVITFNHIPFVSPGFGFFDYEEDTYYGPQLLKQKGQLKHRHIVHNFNEVMKCIGNRSYPLALSGHYHMAQEASFEGTETLFAQTAAIARPDTFEYHGFPGRSGFTLYRVKGNKIVDSSFIPLNYP